jgi:hypothetical protein
MKYKRNYVIIFLVRTTQISFWIPLMNVFAAIKQAGKLVKIKK